MTSSDKAAYWQQHFTDWQQSGLSQSDYCKQHELTLSSFGYWRQRLKASTSAGAKLIPLNVSRPTLINVYFPSGIRIEAPLHGLGELLPLLASEASR